MQERDRDICNRRIFVFSPKSCHKSIWCLALPVTDLGTSICKNQPSPSPKLLPSLPFLISWQKSFWVSIISICMDFPHIWVFYVTNCITRLAFPQRCKYLPLRIKMEIVGNGRCHIPAWLFLKMTPIITMELSSLASVN